jgi:hypothetical protein
MVYDIIGDLHGSAGKLIGLLKKLGYRERNGAFRLSGHQAVFVGDLVDRGAQQIWTLNAVRSMTDAGSAQVTMGNHEFNAIGFATEGPGEWGDYLRTHDGPKGAKSLRQHGAFLEEIAFGSRIHLEIISWFKSLPLWIDTDQFRVAHACWHRQSIETLSETRARGDASLDEFFNAANKKGTDEYAAVKIILKGPQIKLADYGLPPFQDRDGHPRYKARIRWWDARATTLRDIALIPDGAVTDAGLAYPEVPAVAYTAGEGFHYGPEEKPLFFGHYWKTGDPMVDGPTAACLDYSAEKKDGRLMAYQYDGEPNLTNDKFVSFPE